MSDMEVGIDRFAVAVQEILDSTVEGIDVRMPKAVKRGCRVARDEAKKNAPFRGVQHPSYRDSLSYKVQKNGRETIGEVGSKLYPGLVHLLEKGHATIGGGRVEGRKHFEPAADEGEKAFLKAIDEALGEVL